MMALVRPTSLLVLGVASLAAAGCSERGADLDFDPEDVMDPVADCAAGTPVGSPACAADFGDLYETQSLRDTYAFMFGRWRLCSVQKDPYVNGGLPEGIGDHDGLDFLSGGEIELLFVDASGELVHKNGLDYEGDVTLGLNGPASVFFEMDFGADLQAHIVGSTCPRKLRISFIGGPTHIREYRAEIAEE